MAAEKNYWRATSKREVLETNWYIPHDIAFNPNNQFYFGTFEDYASQFDMIVFLHSPEDKTQVVFRFWTVHEQLLDDNVDWDLFAAGPSIGWLSLGLKPLEDLIELIGQHTRDLIDVPESQPIFQLIPQMDYADYFIEASPSKETFIYKHEHPFTGDLPDTNTFLYCSPRAYSGRGIPLSISLKTIRSPKMTAHTRDFGQAMDASYGSLMLTKRGAEEFCRILREQLEFLKQNGRLS